MFFPKIYTIYSKKHHIFYRLPKIKFKEETEEFIVTSNLTVSALVNYTKEMGYDFSPLNCIKADYIGKEKVNRLYNAQIEHRKEVLKIDYAEGNAGSFFANRHIRNHVGKAMKGLLLENPSININVNGATFSPDGNMQFRTEYNTTDKDVAKFFQHVINK